MKNQVIELQNSLKKQRRNNGVAHILSELQQIAETRTLERAQYYIRRLVKGLTVVKSGKLNDLNLNRWKEYNDIITDSLWILDKRDRTGTHSADYWGNFIPQIPHQLLLRYTKKNEWVLDPFLGSGTTLIECKRLGRNGIGVELQSSIVRKTRKALIQVKSPYLTTCEIFQGDSTILNLHEYLRKMGVRSIQFALLHPPYWNIIKFSSQKNDLSNAKSLHIFLDQLGLVIKNCASVLEDGRYLAVVIGDKYCNGEWIPLGFLSMQEVLKQRFKLKSIIVKNFKQTKAKRSQEELWRYRALVGGFYVFKHEYIFLFQKK